MPIFDDAAQRSLVTQMVRVTMARLELEFGQVLAPRRYALLLCDVATCCSRRGQQLLESVDPPPSPTPPPPS